MKLQKQSDGSDTQQRKENIPASIPVKEPPSLSQQATTTDAVTPIEFIWDTWNVSNPSTYLVSMMDSIATW